MIHRLLPTPGDWIALLVWLAGTATAVRLLLADRLEVRRGDRDVVEPVEQFDHLRQALRPDRSSR